MSQIYVDTRMQTDGTGSIQNPRNTCDGISLQTGDTLLLRAGTVVPAAHTSALTLPDGVTLGYYGSGAKPVISGAMLRSDWVQYAPGILSRAVAGGLVGNVRTLDGQHLQFRQTANPASLTAGQYTYTATDGNLYVAGSDGAYYVAETRFGIYDLGLSSGVTIEGLEINSVSTHGILFFGKKRLQIRNVDLTSIGGYWSPTGSYFYGNGIELSAGVAGAEVVDCTASDIFDTAFTAQTYNSDGSFGLCSDVVFSGLSANRCGMAAFEASAHNANQFVSGILFESSSANNIGIGCYSGNRTGAVCLVARSQNYRASTNNCQSEFVGIYATNAQKCLFSRMEKHIFVEMTGGNMLTDHYGLLSGSAMIDGVERADVKLSISPSRSEFC